MASLRTDELLELINTWSKPLHQDAGFRAFNRGKIQSALDLRDEEPKVVRPPFVWPGDLEAQHDAVMAFYYLWAAVDRLQTFDLYFRRFPFRRGEMLKHHHLQNVLDLFFAGFYVVQQRLEAYFKALKPLVARQPDVGKLIKTFKKDFDTELRPRHQATHERPYDDVVFDRLWITDVMARGDEQPDVWRREQRGLYRRETRRLAKLARQRAARLLVYLEAVAEYTLANAAFLETPAQLPGRR